ncbi:MAG: 50S ribosomal protein L11 methyltransferase [Thermodesulfobacteriota bacterium]
MQDEPVFEYHSDESIISFSLPDSSKKSIKINPGWSFGTGNHETTRLCIKALEEVFKNQHLKDVLDIGCGSGVLSICASSLGATNITGIDIDSSIIEEAKYNALNNNQSDFIKFSSKPLSEIEQKFQLIIANILLETVEGLLPEILKKIANKSFLIVSGIRIEEAQKAKDLFTRSGFELKNQSCEKEWIAFTFQL